MLKKFWQLLRLYLVLGVGEERESAEEETQSKETTEETTTKETQTEETADDLESIIEDAPPSDKTAKPSRENDTIRELRERAIRAEAERDAERRQRQAPPPVDEEVRLRESEDATYERERAAGATPERLEQLDYWRRDQRDRRETKRMAREALFSSADARDRADFDSVRLENPARYKRYVDKVEQVRNEAIAKGQQPPPRKGLYYFLLGQDMDKAKTQPKAKAVEKESTVNRGKPLSAKGDVSAKQRQSERDARRERLKTTFI